MPHMLELIKQSAVPANIVRAASKGALALPAGEMLEILVYLTTNPVFGEQARMTLAGWDEKACQEVLGDPATSYEVLNYFLNPQNRRSALLPFLLENRSVRESALLELAQTDSREVLIIMLASARVRRSPDLLQALASHGHITPTDQQQIEEALRAIGAATTEIEAMMEEPAADAGETPVEEKSAYEIEHAAAIAAEEAENKPFGLVGGPEGAETAPHVEVAPVEEQAAPAEPVAEAVSPSVEAPSETSAGAGDTQPAAAPAAPIDERAKKMREAEAASRERITTLQKISRLTVGQRIQLAMKGNKEERYILVRDGSKLVSQAVLQSPKLTDLEVESFAALKNVQEGVLREIARSPKFKKIYSVVRALVNNPRTPMDLGLTLINHLMVNDLKALSTNKNVGDTIRKIALKRFKEKTEKKKPGD